MKEEVDGKEEGTQEGKGKKEDQIKAQSVRPALLRLSVV